jgi:RNA polymerase sigma factor (TIGR02999 family)
VILWAAIKPWEAGTFYGHFSVWRHYPIAPGLGNGAEVGLGQLNLFVTFHHFTALFNEELLTTATRRSRSATFTSAILQLFCRGAESTREKCRKKFCDTLGRDKTLGGPAPSMDTSPSGDITQLLRAWGTGDERALEQLTPLVYAELRKAAKRRVARERDGHTLQATALINEVYLRLVNLDGVGWQDRAHFFAICAQMMRRILTDYARSRGYLKRGGDAQRVTFDEGLMVSADPGVDLVGLEEALQKLAAVDARKSSVVELRFFGGLSIKETAAVLKVSTDTVTRDWNLAKAWLLREMEGEARDGC